MMIYNDFELEDHAVDIYLEENKDITSPGSLDWDTRSAHVSIIRNVIEETIKKQWDIFESSRVIDISKVTANKSLIEIKKALIPYVKKGWFVTISFPCSKNNNIMNTYEADSLFVSTNNYGKKDQF